MPYFVLYYFPLLCGAKFFTRIITLYQLYCRFSPDVIAAMFVPLIKRILMAALFFVLGVSREYVKTRIALFYMVPNEMTFLYRTQNFIYIVVTVHKVNFIASFNFYFSVITHSLMERPN